MCSSTSMQRAMETPAPLMSVLGAQQTECLMAAHSSTLAWRAPWTEEPGGTVCGATKESNTTEHLSTELPGSFYKLLLSFI